MTGVWSERDAAAWVRAPRADDDKYRRGVVGMRTGSPEYPGAAVLAVEAAWRTGIGMVRFVGADAVAQFVLQRRPETVRADGRVQAWVVGSGTDAASRTDSDTAALRAIVAGDAPVIVDAGALDLLPATAPVVATPHAGEFARVRMSLGLGEEPDRVLSCVQTARALGAAVLLKGAETVIAAPDGWSTTVTEGIPWLATAGTGDVLAAAIGALAASWAAQHPVDAGTLARLAATGAFLHARAARVAVERSGGPVTALDVAEALPAAVGALLAVSATAPARP